VASSVLDVSSETSINTAQAQPEPLRVGLTRPKIGFVSLGCPKNLVDSEVMMGLLDRAAS
jgi:ribosomal protein S12 methylthiotransferase